MKNIARDYDRYDEPEEDIKPNRREKVTTRREKVKKGKDRWQ